MRYALLFLLLLTPSLYADIWLDARWGEGMTLPHGVPARLNGIAKPGEKIVLSFRGQKYETVADKVLSTWHIDVDPGQPGGPFPLTIQGNNTIELKSVSVVELALGQVFGDGMVLQRGTKAPIFGTATPATTIRVAFRAKGYQTKADAKGMWRVDIEPGTAGGPFPLTVEGNIAIALKEVYVGEVWLCSGQSNMRWGPPYTRDWGNSRLV